MIDTAGDAPVRSLLADGSPITVRLLDPADLEQVDALHARLSTNDHYLRFFGMSRVVDLAIGASIVGDNSVAVGAFHAGRLIGIAHYVPIHREDPEVAFVVDHADQHRGIATLLLEHLAAAARLRGVRRLVAEVLSINSGMLGVFTDVGFPVTLSREDDVTNIVIDISASSDAYLDAVADREERADVRSLTPLLAPRSVAVIGAGRRRTSVGHAILRRLIAGGFTGPIHAVNPHAAVVGGVPCHRSVSDLPEPVDLAVLCVPAQAVPGVAAECGRRGVRSLLVITSGVSTDPVLAAGLRAATEEYDMRLVGPNCLGVVNTDPMTRMDASFGVPPQPGSVGIVTQSGGIAVGLVADLDRLGLGVSTMVSTGDSLDVNGDDLLLWWRHDDRTRAAVLYLESLRHPRKFARLARRLARGIPVLTVRAGTTEVGQRAAASHSASSATPGVTRDALFRQAGILAVDRMSELTELLAALSWQPLPAGRRVAVLSNAGGAGVLAADACVQGGLVVPQLGEDTVTRLRSLLPATASVSNPVDTGATVEPGTFSAVLTALLADPRIDAVLAVAASTAVGGPQAGIAPAAIDSGKPVLAVRLGQPAGIDRLDAPEAGGDGWRAVPCFADPAAAAAALGRMAERAEWLARTSPAIPDPDGFDHARAEKLVADFLTGRSDGGWLDPATTRALFDAAGLPLAPLWIARDADEAVARWRQAGGAVALKADAVGVLHKSTAGGVRLGLDSEDAVRQAAGELGETFGTGLTGLVVQPMAQPGVELLVGVVGDPLFGPLITFGLGGTSTDLVADRAHCLVPPTDADVDELLDGLRGSPQLFGPIGLDRERLRDVVLRLAALAELLPEIAEAEINPLICRQDDVVGVDARVRIIPARRSDPFLRTLPT